jgi:hypothetical protein
MNDYSAPRKLDTQGAEANGSGVIYSLIET